MRAKPQSTLLQYNIWDQLSSVLPLQYYPCTQRLLFMGVACSMFKFTFAAKFKRG